MSPHQVPTPIAVPEASGSADILYNTDNNLLSWDIVFDNLSGPATGLHFHGLASPGENAGVVVNIGNISGLTSPSIGSISITEVQEEELLSGLWYIRPLEKVFHDIIKDCPFFEFARITVRLAIAVEY